MRPEDLLNGMNHIDDELIEEALQKEPVRKKRIWVIPVAAAACMTLLVGYSVMRTGIAVNHYEQTSVTQETQQEAASGLLQEETEASEINHSASGEAAVPAAGNYDEVYTMLKLYNDAQILDGDIAYMTEAAAEGIVTEEAPLADSGTAAKEAAATGASNHSGTNVMVEGIDESDLVKTDGKYIYRVSGTSVIRTDIRDGRPGAESTIELPDPQASDNILELFLDEKYLTVIGEMTKTAELQQFGQDYARPEGILDQVRTFAAVYDISGEAPQFTGLFTQDGYYNTARKQGSRITLFTNVYLYAEAFEKDGKMNAPEQWVPQAADKMIPADSIYMAEDSDSGILASTFTESRPEVFDDAKFIFLHYAQVYVGPTAVWLYYNDYMYGSGSTKIISMPYGEGRIHAGSTCSVKGSITDRFAISEGPDTLRVLATVDNGSGQTDNRLYLLDKDSLELTGFLTGIAKGEYIYAARYIGDTAYFVTYRNTDPVFAADIADPAHPKLLGKLKISGFSDYMHPWDEDHMLGLGYETDPVTGTFLGIKLTMFNVSDPTDIKAEDTMVIREGRASSAIDYNYKAILADPEKNLIGFSALEGEEDVAWMPYYNVFTWQAGKGFERLLHAETEDDDAVRGLYAEETFYIVGNDVTAFSMTGKEWKVIP